MNSAHDSAETTDRLRSVVMDSPVGDLTVIASDRGLRAVLWPDDRPDRVPLVSTVPEPGVGLDLGGAGAVLRAATLQLDEYFRGDRTEFDLPLDVEGTDFQQRAWHALCSIPFAQTTSYGEQAERMGDRRKARAVGAANGRNPISIIVPCHRVVGANGSLTGFAGGIDAKRWLLAHEQRVAGLTLL